MNMNGDQDYPDILLDLAEEFVSRQRNGDHPDIEYYVQQLPEHESAIRELFPAMGMLQGETDGAEGKPKHGLLPDDLPRCGAAFGDYRIVREIGRGGMGIVYEAEQVSLGRSVALKILPRRSDNGDVFWKRFEQEAKTAARLHHTNIVPVYSVGQVEGVCFYSMQLIHGESLEAKVIRQRRKLDGETPGSGASTSDCEYQKHVARLGVQAADALQYAHNHGVLHRDIKPSNFLIDEDSVLWLTDFGLAKIDQGSDFTGTGDILGTLRYLPPEAFSSEYCSSSDQYSLGLTLFELLTGQAAFSSTTRARLIDEIVNGSRPVIPSSLNVAADLQTILLKSTEREPQHRYPTVGEMRDDLQRFLNAEPVRARQTSQLELLARWAKRKPTVAALLTALLFSLMAGLGLVSWKWWESEFHRVEAVVANSRITEEKRLAERNLYFSDVANAYQLYQLNEPERARKKLEAAKANPEFGSAPPWEWKFLNGLLESEIRSLDANIPKASWVNCITYSNDGNYIAIGNRVPPFNNVRRDTQAGIQVFDVSTGNIVLDLTGQTLSVEDVVFSDDNSRIACCHYNQLSPGRKESVGIKVWEFDASSAQTDRSPPAIINFDFVDSLTRLRFSKSGSFLLGLALNELIVWDLDDSGKDPIRQKLDVVLTDLELGETETQVVLRGLLKKKPLEIVWDWERSVEISRNELPANGIVDANRKYLVYKSGPRKIKVLDFESSRLMHVLPGHNGATSMIEISPDGERLASGGTDNTVRIWDLNKGVETHLLRGHSNRISSIEFNSNGSQLASGDWSGEVKLWDLTRTTDQQDIGAVWPFISYDRALINDERQLLVAHMTPFYRQEVKLIRRDMNSGRNLQAIDFKEIDCTRPLPPYRVMDFLNHGAWLAAVNSASRSLDVYQTSNGKALFNLTGHSSPIDLVYGSDEGTRIVSSAGTIRPADDETAEVIIWDAEKQISAHKINGQGLTIDKMALDKTGNMLAMACRGATKLVDRTDTESRTGSPRIEIWNLNRADRIGTIPRRSEATQADQIFLQFDSSGKQLVVFDWADMKLKIFDLEKKQMSLVVAASERFFGVNFSNDGQRIVAATRADTTVLDAETGYEILTLRGIPKLQDPIFLPLPFFDSKDNRLISVQHNGYLRIWGESFADQPKAERIRSKMRALEKRIGATANK